MKLPYFKISLLLLVSFVLINCKSSKNEASAKVEDNASSYLVFLDKAAAEKQINQDATDGFFESLTIADMSIQLKNEDMSDISKSKTIYREYLRSEMETFNEDEKKFMKEVFETAKSALDAINPKLLPKSIELIKTKTNHYGPDVYYTREDAIILPDNIFEEPSITAQMPVMLHEIFHILSRYNKDFRDKMYALIGFSHFDEKLILPREVADKILTNPDGVRRDYAIKLKDENGKEQLALPLILSTKERFQPEMPTFFAYLSFDLYPLIKVNKSQMTLQLNRSGESALSIGHNADFFKQIKDNTQYIIHPDEIMADNFMMAVIANKNNSFESFSEEGKQLLKDVLEILRTYK